MKIIVGLGNIGSNYEFTRHNVGFMALNRLADFFEKDTGVVAKWKKESDLKSEVLKTSWKGESIVLVKPVTFMNLSGKAVNAVLSFYKQSLDDLLIVFDDVDLPLGEVRFRETGSAGTHNGMRSIIGELGLNEFARVKIGIESRGTYASGSQDLSSFVLSRFLAEEEEILFNSLDLALDKIKGFIENKKKLD